jgi:D-methionine transport system ATP-binding protein
VEEVLGFVGLDGRQDAYPAQLSGGQRQRVGIARALVSRPRLLLCDEPTSSLDATTTDGVLELLREARDRFGTTVVVVTHDLAVVRRICDRVALFESGALRDVLTVGPSARHEQGSYLDRARRELGS